MFLRKAKVFRENKFSKGTFDEHDGNPNTFQVSSFDKFDDVGDYYFSTFIVYDPMNVRITRYDHTWIMWLAMLGGVMSAVGGYFMIIALSVSRKMFMNDVL